MQTIALPVISSLAAGILILGQMALMFVVTRVRRGARVSLGDGGKPGVQAAIRRHGNYAENAAIFIAGLTLLEMIGGGRPLLIGLAAVFIAGRIAHAIGLSLTPPLNLWRVGGIFATIAAGVTLGIRLLALALSHLG